MSRDSEGQMRHFPIFLDLTGRRVLFSGAGDISESKIRLVMKTAAIIEVYGHDPNRQIREWANTGRIKLSRRRLQDADIGNAVLLYCANGQTRPDRDAARLAEARGVLVNVVDNLEDSHFITPAIVDRNPVTVAIGTEGAAPVLARLIKSDLETRLPVATGALARIARSFRGRAALIRSPRKRREFWARFFGREGPEAWSMGGEAATVDRLKGLLVESLAELPEKGSVHFIDASPGDPDFLSVRSKRLLESADRVVHDKDVAPAILELARREAQISAGPVERLLESGVPVSASNGKIVVCLMSNILARLPLLEALRCSLAAKGISCEILESFKPPSGLAAMQGVG